MKVCHVAVPVLLAALSAPAVADDMSLAPTCAVIDETRDTLSPQDRTLAVAQLERALLAAAVLVVPQDCTERYTLSHEMDGERAVVRLAGPDTVMRVNDPGAAEREAAYAHLIAELLESRDPDPVVVEDVASPVAETHMQAGASEVRTDGVFYGKVMAGNYGGGFALGGHFLVTKRTGLDISAGRAGTTGHELGMLAAKVVRYRDPDSDTSLYYGGGMSFATQRNEDSTGSGARIDGSLGVAFARTQQTRIYLAADLSLPLFGMSGGMADGYDPTIMFSLGIGR